MRVLLVGLGAVGTRVARELLAHDDVESLTLVHRHHARAAVLTEGFDDRVVLRAAGSRGIPPGTDVVVLATTTGTESIATAGLRAGAHVVAALDDPAEIRDLLALDGVAREMGRTLAAGVTMAPGLSCVLARYGARDLDRVEQIHVASFGTGGPACARRHHAALSSLSTDWYDGAWRRRAGGSGRELVWFPEPVGGADCYRARLVDPTLLVPAFPGVARVTARLQATRRDRLTSALPMLRRPHPEGVVGAVRVELRGWRSDAFSAEVALAREPVSVGTTPSGGPAPAATDHLRGDHVRGDQRLRLPPMADTIVVGSVGRPALVAGTVAAICARWAAGGRLARTGAGGLAELIEDPAAFLRDVTVRGIRVSVFEGLSPGETDRPE